MNKTLLFLILLPISIFAQSENHVINKRLSIGPSFAAGYSYRQLKVPVNSSDKVTATQWVDSLNSLEYGKLAFSFGVSLKYRISGRLGLYTGFYYTDKGIRSKGFVYGNGIWSGNNRFTDDEYKARRFYFYEVPMALTWHSKKANSRNKPGFYLFVGPILSINSNEHYFNSRKWHYIELNGGYRFEEYYSTKLNLLDLGCLGGAGVRHAISDKLWVYIEPLMKYYFKRLYMNDTKKNSYTPTISQLPVNEKPYFISVNLGIDYLF